MIFTIGLDSQVSVLLHHLSEGFLIDYCCNLFDLLDGVCDSTGAIYVGVRGR